MHKVNENLKNKKEKKKAAGFEPMILAYWIANPFP